MCPNIFDWFPEGRNQACRSLLFMKAIGAAKSANRGTGETGVWAAARHPRNRRRASGSELSPGKAGMAPLALQHTPASRSRTL